MSLEAVPWRSKPVRRIVIIHQKSVQFPNPDTTLFRFKGGSHSARRSSVSQIALLPARRNEGRSKSAAHPPLSKAESRQRQQAFHGAETRLQDDTASHQ